MSLHVVLGSFASTLALAGVAEAALIDSDLTPPSVSQADSRVELRRI